MLTKWMNTALVFLAAAFLLTGYSVAYAQTRGLIGPQNLPEPQGIASVKIVIGNPSTGTLYSQPPSPSGGLLQSSRWDPDGSDYDRYVWDSFMLPANTEIDEIRWRGGFDPTKFGSGGPVIDFVVAIYPSIPAGIQPDVVNPPLVEYRTGGNAGETPAGTAGGAAMYDYQFTLPQAFNAAAGTKYWLQIEALQHGIPDWGITAGTGGNGTHFRKIAAAADTYYQTAPGDAAFSLLGPTNYSYWIYLPLTIR